MDNTIVLFKNWSNEEFSWKWNGMDYTFRPGETKFMELWKAAHFGKHLTDREMMKAKLPTDHHSRKDYEVKCVSSVDKFEGDSSAVSTKIIDMNMNQVEKKPEPEKKPDFKPFCDLCASKGVRHLKSCPKYVPIAPRENKVEEVITNETPEETVQQ
jgi:hypothetical protein